jgi:hypothetical protein
MVKTLGFAPHRAAARPNSTNEYVTTKSFSKERGAYAIPLGTAVTWIELSEK